MNKINYKNLSANVLLSLVTILFCAILVVFVIEVRYFIQRKEYLSCAWHDPNTRFDSELGWSPIPNRKIYHPAWGTVSSNSLGFRSPEIDQNKNQIIVLGDSYAWGFGVSDTETFPYYLDKMVSKFNYQVLNLGVSGYGIDQYYLFLKRHISKFNKLKQVILLINVQNDFVGTAVNVDNGKKKPLFVVKNNNLILTNKDINEHCLRNLFSRSYFLGMGWPDGIVGNTLSKMAGDKILSVNETEKVSVMLLQKIFEMVVDHNAKLLVVLKPSKKDFTKPTFHLRFFEYVFNKVRFKGLSYIDYIEVLKKENPKELNDFYLEDEHYNKKGNKFLAKTVYEQLRKELKD